MASPDPTDRESCGPESPAAEDASTERTVLRFVLTEHPDQATVAEIHRALYPDADDFATRDAVGRAVRDLAAAGLVRRQDEAVVPTLAALRFRRLEAE
ncbi:MAG TPA: hypothetical protein VFY04_08560 [Solirubrobacterales bacterium]|nr:hypothetical protein [Solirubrobacterales bacterium]